MTHAAGFEHDALLYETDAELVETLAPWLREGLALGQGAAVVTSTARIDLLREALDGDSDAIAFAASEDWYTTPAVVIASWYRACRTAAASGASYMRIVGEVPFGQAADDHARWTRFESAVNYAFAGCSSWNVCPYDLRSLPESVIEDAWRTHPTVWHADRRPSNRYTAPSDLFAQIPEPTPALPARPFARVASSGDLNELRRLVRGAGEHAGLPADRVEDLVLVFSEVAANAVCHARGITCVTLWIVEGGVVCEVRDEGAGLTDALKGLAPPLPEALGGKGLWIARQLSTWLVIDSGQGRGTTVRFALTPGRLRADAH